MTSRVRRLAASMGAASLALAGCAVSGYDGYGGDVDVGYVGGYYEPWGYDYGGWGGRYRVGPPRGDWDHGPGGGHPHGGGRPVGAAPGAHGGGGRGAPSIPSGPRR